MRTAEKLEGISSVVAYTLIGVGLLTLTTQYLSKQGIIQPENYDALEHLNQIILVGTWLNHLVGSALETFNILSSDDESRRKIYAQAFTKSVGVLLLSYFNFQLGNLDFDSIKTLPPFYNQDFI